MFTAWMAEWSKAVDLSDSKRIYYTHYRKMQGFEPPSTQHNGFNIFQLKNIVVPGWYICSYSVVVITVDFEIHFT